MRANGAIPQLEPRFITPKIERGCQAFGGNVEETAPLDTKNNEKRYKTMTKKQFEYYKRYMESNATHLYDVYRDYSCEKSRAFKNCIAIEREYHGFDGRIISHNTCFFTYAFKFWESHEQHMCVITPTKRIVFKIGA